MAYHNNKLIMNAKRLFALVLLCAGLMSVPKQAFSREKENFDRN